MPALPRGRRATGQNRTERPMAKRRAQAITGTCGFETRGGTPRERGPSLQQSAALRASATLARSATQVS